jgi:hypothetical protein
LAFNKKKYAIEISIHKVTLSSPCLWASFHPLSPLSVVSAKSRHFIKSQYDMLQFSMKCWNSAFNAQGSRLIIVLVQVGAMKNENICSNNGKTGKLRKKERQDETQFTTWFSEFHPLLNANVLFYRFFFKKFTLCKTKFRVLVFCFSYFMDNSDGNKMLNWIPCS